jgi:predicted MFS family arabinose efflux permease
MIALDPEASGAALGALVLASALASLISAYVWGRLADRSSRQVLALAAALACATLALTVLAAARGWIAAAPVLAALVFAIMIAHQGVRLGRSTHLVDMAGKEDRALYTALSNSVIGLLLLAGGGFALVAEAFGPASVVAALAAMAGLAILAALGLKEVQR